MGGRLKTGEDAGTKAKRVFQLNKMEEAFINIISKKPQELTSNEQVIFIGVLREYFSKILYILITTEPAQWKETLDKYGSDKPAVKDALQRWGNPLIDLCGKYIVKIARSDTLFILRPKSYEEFMQPGISGKSTFEECFEFIVRDIEKEEKKKKQKARLPLFEGQKFINAPHSEITNSLALPNEVEAKTETNQDMIMRGNIIVFTEKVNEQKAKLGVNTDKLLSMIEALFISKNSKKGKIADPYIVKFSVLKYGLACGVPLLPKETNTPEEAQREANRVINATREYKKQLKEALSSASNSNVTLFDFVKSERKQREGFANIKLIGSFSIVGDVASVAIDPVYGEYLLHRPLTRLPRPIFKIDARHANAYRIAKKITEHFFMDSNQHKGIAEYISVSSLLNCVDLPSIEDVRTRRSGWGERILEPFLTCLDYLTKEIGLLENWEFCHAKDNPLSDEEASYIDSFESFSSLLLKFTIKDVSDFINSDDEIKRRNERIARITKARQRKESRRREAAIRVEMKKIEATEPPQTA